MRSQARSATAATPTKKNGHGWATPKKLRAKKNEHGPASSITGWEGVDIQHGGPINFEHGGPGGGCDGETAACAEQAEK